MTEVTKEFYIRAIIVDIQEKHNSHVVDEVITTPKFASQALECYNDLLNIESSLYN